MRLGLNRWRCYHGDGLRLSPLADFESVRYLTWLSKLLSRRRTAVASARRPTAWIRSQLLLLAKLLDRWLLPADDTPELELVVDVGDVEPRPGSVLASAVLFIDCFPIKKKWKEIVTHKFTCWCTGNLKNSFPFTNLNFSFHGKFIFHQFHVTWLRSSPTGGTWTDLITLLN